MANHGKAEEYDLQEEWSQYIERLEYYFEANGVESADKQRAILLSVCGSKTYKLIRNLTTPAKPSDKTFKELVELVQIHQNPKPSVIVQRFKFNTRFRKPGESIASFVAELRNLSEHCDFQNTLEEMLRDRLVCGINDEQIQRRLLAETTLDFKKAMKIATSMEAAVQNAKDLSLKMANDAQQSQPVNRMDEKQRGNQQDPRVNDCGRCGGKHDSQQCKFRDAECFVCRKKGHIARKCRSRPKESGKYQRKEDTPNSGNRNKYLDIQEESDEDGEIYTLLSLGRQRTEPYVVDILVSEDSLKMEVDTGAAMSVISEDTYKSLKKNHPSLELKESKVKLHTYTGEQVQVVGMVETPVKYEDQEITLPVLVIQGKGPNLIGRNWLRKIKLNWRALFQVREENVTTAKVQELLQKYEEVFQDGLGTFTGPKAKIHVAADAKPKYCKARPVPYSLREKVEKELERLQEEGTIEPVQFAEWAAPIVPIVKEDKSIRICGDYKITVNQAAKLDNYPIPKAEDLFATLSGGVMFTKLDMSQAYQQILLEEESKKYTTINTHKGLFQYNRLPYGVSSSPGIFQRTMDNLLQGIPFVVVRVDDILVSGSSDEEHLANLEEVLKRLFEAGLRLKKKKCSFMVEEVVYLGQKINCHGIQPVQEKVRAITEAPAPKNVSEVRAYLGMINYYQKYLPNLSTILAPLHSLLEKGKDWKWNEKHQESFTKSKELLKSSHLLVHYDPEKDLILACDASPYGVGSVLSHRMEDNTERPIAFASRSLSPAEKNYSQLDKEALAIIVGVKKFHQYLYGRHFTILTDHKPLERVFHPDKMIPPMAAARIQRWALTLSAYDYTIQYKEGSQNANADALSRLPLPEIPASTPVPGETILLMELLEMTPINAEQVKNWTRRNPVLAKVLKFVKQGWPHKCPDADLQPYFQRREELSVQDDCILWGTRVVVPPQGRNQVVEELHETHPGICKMKGLARSYVWWPNMDSALESKVRNCHHCQVNRKNPPEAPLHPWEWPSQPWERIHIDYAGPFMGKMFLVMVDAYSKWLEVHPMSVATSRATIEKLRSTFAIHGIPTTIVSDNGSNFCSQEFEEFLTKNGIHHRRTAPYHPASNGLAERAVQTFKEGMKKMSMEGSLETRVSRFLFKYRITPHSTTRISPAEMLMGRKPRSRLDLLYPDVRDRVQNEQRKQKELHDQHVTDRQLQPGDLVYAKEFGKQQKWSPGIIHTQTGPVSYTVKLDDHREVRRHQDQVFQRSTPPANNNEPSSNEVTKHPSQPAVEASCFPERQFETTEENELVELNTNCPQHPERQLDQEEEPSISVRCSLRERRAPEYYY